MGWKKKIKKRVEGYLKSIEEHQKKLEDYNLSGGKDYALISYWEKEIERLKKEKEDEEERLGE